MDEKCFKTKVSHYETVLAETAECPIDADFTLPDFCPDISKILKCRAVARISSKGVTGKTLTVDGNAPITVLYCEESGALHSFEYQYPFSKTIELPEEAENAEIRLSARCEYLNCRAVTARKIDIHGAIAIKARVLRVQNTEILSDFDDADVEQRRETAPATMPMGFTEKTLMIEEEIPIGQGAGPIVSVLRYDAKPTVDEAKIINDKIVTKGNLAVSVLYAAENASVPQSLKTVLPFSQILELEGIHENCKCETNAELSFLEIRVKSVDHVPKTFYLTAKLYLSAVATCDNELAVITDAYSRRHAADIHTDRVQFDRIARNVNEVYHCKKNLTVDSPINSVIELWCDLQTVSSRFEDQEMILSGTLAACMIAADEENAVSYIERAVDFEYRCPLNEDTENLSCVPRVDVLSCGYTLLGPDSVELRVDLHINAAIHETKEMTLVTGIDVLEKPPQNSDDHSAMTIYFAEEGERLWDIAKRYNAGNAELMQINQLNSEILPEGTMLLIPSA